jgi:1-deoxy-D-xylulose-5-phosphate reductoisomerase
MRIPISYALHYPERADVVMKPLDLAAVGKLTFELPDTASFPCLELAREAAEAGGTAPCTLNAANEVAVHGFLGRRLAFLDIARVIEGTLDAAEARPVLSFEDLYEADEESRRLASDFVGRLAVSA